MVPSLATVIPRGFMRPLATVGHTAPDALALALALALSEAALEALAAGEEAAIDELGRGGIVANDGFGVTEGAAHAAAASAAAARVTRPVRAPTLNRGKRKDMNKNSYTVDSTLRHPTLRRD